MIPFLHYVDEGVAQTRGTGVRARGSAQHPIALSAALVMLVPLAFYLYQRHRSRIWLACAALLTLGALSTGSRTGTTMLIARRPRASSASSRARRVRLLPWLLPMLVVIQVVMPGTLGTMKSMLNPSYVIKEQSYDQGATAGRIADLGPALDRWATQAVPGLGLRDDGRRPERAEGERAADPRRPVARQPAPDRAPSACSRCCGCSCVAIARLAAERGPRPAPTAG